MSILKPKAFWPVTIDATNNKIYYNNGSLDGEGTIASATYLSAVLLAAAVQTAIQGGTNPLTSCTVAVTATGFFTFTRTSTFSMRWATTTNSIYLLLGATASNQTASDIGGGQFQVTVVGQHQNGWYSPTAVLDDSFPVRDRVMDVVTRNMSGQTKHLTEAELSERVVVFAYLPPEKTYTANAVGNDLYTAIELWWANGRSRFRYWIDGTVEGTSTDYVLEVETCREFKPKRMNKRKALYEVQFKFWGYVA